MKILKPFFLFFKLWSVLFFPDTRTPKEGSCDDGLERVVGDELRRMESEKSSMRWGGWGGERERGRGWVVVRERERQDQEGKGGDGRGSKAGTPSKEEGRVS